MSSPKRTLLITGCTGKQGGALIQHLLSHPSTPSQFHIIGLVRDASTPRAQRLAAQGITLVTGDLSDPDAIFTSAMASIPADAQTGDKPNAIWGVFSVQTNNPLEEKHGKMLIAAAIKHGVRHFVYSSGDRGGPQLSEVDPTEVKNFAAKFHVEKYLQACCSATDETVKGAGTGTATEAGAGETAGMTYTILRPVTFFENLTTDRHGLGFARMWEQIGAGKKLQLVATRDIGWFAAQSFLNPEDARWRNRAVTLVGDELTQAEADVVFQQVVGRTMPIAPCVVGSMVKMVLRETVGDMFAWFKEFGYGGDVEECRGMNPGMMDFRAWIEENKGMWTGGN